MYQYLGSTDIWLYDFFGGISFIAFLIVSFTFIPQKKLFLGKYTLAVQNFFLNKFPRTAKFNPLAKAGFWAFLEILIYVVLINILFGPLCNMMRDLAKTGVNYFGGVLFAPLILFLILILVRVEPLKQIDLLTPGLAIRLVFGKISCFCAGCCRGIECSWGLYNHNVASGRVEFPVQLVESGLALAIFIFLLHWRKKAKLGTMFPTYLILYSGTRFFSEFLRHEPEVFWIFKTYHILCIIGVVLGVIELLLVLKFGEKISQFDIFNILKKPFEVVKAFFIQRIWSKVKKVFSAYKEKRAKKKREKEKKRQKERVVHHHNKSKKKRRSKKH